VSVFVRGLDWEGVRANEGPVTCVFGLPILFPPQNWNCLTESHRGLHIHSNQCKHNKRYVQYLEQDG